MDGGGQQMESEVQQGEDDRHKSHRRPHRFGRTVKQCMCVRM